MGAAVDSEGKLAADDGVIAPEGALLKQAPPGPEEASDAGGQRRSVSSAPRTRSPSLVCCMSCLIWRTATPSKPLGRYSSWLRVCSAPRRWVQARDTRIVRFKTLQNHYFCKWVQPSLRFGANEFFHQIIEVRLGVSERCSPHVCHRQHPFQFPQGRHTCPSFW